MSIEKFFWSDSPETQVKIDQFLADRAKALKAARAFVKEVGAENIYHTTRGDCVGVEFKGKTPAGWTSKKRHLRTVPEQKTPEGRELFKRLMALKMPTEEQYFIGERSAFSRFWGVIISGNRISFPTATIAKAKGEPGRVLIRCRMLPGAPPKKKRGSWSASDSQHEADFVIPDGYHEWKEWEMLKFVDEFNAKVKA